MLSLNYFLFLTTYLLAIIDDFTKMSTITYNLINLNDFKSIYILYLFSGTLSPKSFIEILINNLNINYKNTYNYNLQFEDLFSINESLIINYFKYIWFLKPNTTTLENLTNKYSLVLFDVVFNSFFFLIIFFFFNNFFIKITKKITNTVFIIQRLTKEQDQEVSSFEDFLVFIVFFLSFFINILNFYSNKELIQTNFYASNYLLFILFFSIVIIVPTFILVSAGVNFIMYIKGVNKVNSMLANIIDDSIGILAFFLRFFLQVIRWCLFLTTFYLLHEFVFEWMYSLLLNIFNNNDFLLTTYQKINNNIILQLILHFLRFSFELFDTFLILIIQVTAFIAVIMWLFNFLFSLSLDDIKESLFINNIK